MAWDHLSINKPHLVYIILGGFTSLFMLCSSVIKERMYIGEATVATLCGIIFGPHAADLINPLTWGNTDQITLEFSRIVLVVQCFAVGVELPKYYMEKHWRSVVFLLIPVMTFGWLVTSLFIWWMVPSLSWLESLCVAACVTATDPVLASSVVGKGKFAKRVPKHLRDLLSAESGCNDGMAFPFIYLALYLIEYNSKAGPVTFHWICITVLYECIFGAVYGFIIGYIARHGIKFAEKHDLVDRESFLVFYFVLALFCAGSGSILGVDDLLVGFTAGVGFSNDGWFTNKTEESHVSNVIDLLINLAYFVYLGTIIPWEQYNWPEMGLSPWRLVVIAIFVILFRRIPVMMALKPFIPDIKTWREALFAGHFGPIGVGAIFVAILARADLETDGGTTPLSSGPPPGSANYELVSLIWPIVTFLVISSIVVHGSSVAVFTLGKHINTLNLTMSYTTAHEDGPTWMNRLPRISSQSKSMAKTEKSENSVDLNLPHLGVPEHFLRRQEDTAPARPHSRSTSLLSRRRKKRWDGLGPGGPISESAIRPQPRVRPEQAPSMTPESSDSNEKLDIDSEDLADQRADDRGRQQVEAYEEGDHLILENEDGDVITVAKSPEAEDSHEKLDEALDEAKAALEQPGQTYKQLVKKLGNWSRKKDGEPSAAAPPPEHKNRAALMYQFGNTIIVEDEDGEVVKKYDLPPQNKTSESSRGFMGGWGLGGKKPIEDEEANKGKQVPPGEDEDDDRRLRFTIGGMGKRLTKEDFLREVSRLDAKAKSEALQTAKTAASSQTPATGRRASVAGPARRPTNDRDTGTLHIPTIQITRQSSTDEEPDETPAERRRRQQVLEGVSDESDVSVSESESETETPAERRRRLAATRMTAEAQATHDAGGETETPAERRRREAALGMSGQREEDSDDDDTPRVPQRSRGIRFAEDPVREQRRR